MEGNGDIEVILPIYSKKEKIDYLIPEYSDDKKMSINTKKIIGLDCDILNLRKELQEVETRFEKDIKKNFDRMCSIINSQKYLHHDIGKDYSEIRKDYADMNVKYTHILHTQNSHEQRLDAVTEGNFGNLELIKGLQQMVINQQDQIIVLQTIIKNHNRIIESITTKIKNYGFYTFLVFVGVILHFIKI